MSTKLKHFVEQTHATVKIIFETEKEKRVAIKMQIRDKLTTFIPYTCDKKNKEEKGRWMVKFNVKLITK